MHTFIPKIKQKLKKIKILSAANDYKNNYLLPSSKKKTNIDEIDMESIIRELEEKENLKDSENTDRKRRFLLTNMTRNYYK